MPINSHNIYRLTESYLFLKRMGMGIGIKTVERREESKTVLCHGMLACKWIRVFRRVFCNSFMAGLPAEDSDLSFLKELEKGRMYMRLGAPKTLIPRVQVTDVTCSFCQTS